MHDLTDEERKGVLGEVLMDELKAIREYVEDIPVMKKDLAEVKEDVAELKSDMKVVKAAITDQSKELKRHSIIINQLQRKAA